MLAVGPVTAAERLANTAGGGSHQRYARVSEPQANPQLETSPALAAEIGRYARHEALGAALVSLRRRINELELEFARAAAAFAATFDTWDDESPVAWLRDACRMSCPAAVSAIRVGEQEAVLPGSITALLAGRIGIAHLGLLAQTAEFFSERRDPEVAFDETELLAKAERLRVADFRRACFHAEHALDAEACAQREAGDVDHRCLRLSPGEGGSLSLSGSFDREAGVLIRTALEPLAAPSGPDEHRNREQRLGDALVELVGHVLDGNGGQGIGGARRQHLEVVVTLETLRGDAGAPGAETDFGGLLTGSTMQRLACDATITRVLFDPRSARVNVGRTQRVVPPATRRALIARDRGCRWPGCDRPWSWTQAHHLRHWVHHGRTDMDNLVLLCRRHHWYVHEVGYRMELAADGTLRFDLPSG